MPGWRIEPLHSLHQVATFQSGAAALDEWLVRRALANQDMSLTRTYVMVENGVIGGFYSLAAGAVRREEALSSIRRNAPDPVPMIILARLAVATGLQGEGFGRMLMHDAFRRTLQAAELVGVRGMLVHAKSEDAQAFYRAIGFESSPIHAMTLMATLADLRNA